MLQVQTNSVGAGYLPYMLNSTVTKAYFTNEASAFKNRANLCIIGFLVCIIIEIFIKIT